jgi:hypothetical protein
VLTGIQNVTDTETKLCNAINSFGFERTLCYLYCSLNVKISYGYRSIVKTRRIQLVHAKMFISHFKCMRNIFSEIKSSIACPSQSMRLHAPSHSETEA